MVSLDKTIRVHATPDAVWRAVTRVTMTPSWTPGVVRSALRDGAATVAPGVAFTQVREDLGLRLESELVTTRAEAPRRFAWRQVAGDFARYDGHFELSEAPGGTDVRLRVRFELPFILPRLLTEDAIERYYSDAFDAALLTLKEHVESRRQALLAASA